MSNPEVVSHREFARRSIIKRIHTIMVEQEATLYSSTIEIILAELVRDEMITLARSGMVDHPQISLLKEAIKRTKSNLEKRLDGHFDFEPYFEEISEKLKVTAQEIAQLQLQLRKTSEQQQIGKSTKIDDAEVPFEINEVGLQRSLEGMVAIPLIEAGCYLNMREIMQSYQVEGATIEEVIFPFQIKAGELVFIVNDDGSIFISTDNFPGTLVEDARGILKELGRRLYTRVAVP